MKQETRPRWTLKWQVAKRETSPWGGARMTAPCNVVTDEEKREREARSVALEKAYVHDVYDQLSHHFSEERYRPWPRVRQFLEQLEPGSLVCDAGIERRLFS